MLAASSARADAKSSRAYRSQWAVALATTWATCSGGINGTPLSERLSKHVPDHVSAFLDLRWRRHYYVDCGFNSDQDSARPNPCCAFVCAVEHRQDHEKVEVRMQPGCASRDGPEHVDPQWIECPNETGYRLGNVGLGWRAECVGDGLHAAEGSAGMTTKPTPAPSRRRRCSTRWRAPLGPLWHRDHVRRRRHERLGRVREPDAPGAGGNGCQLGWERTRGAASAPASHPVVPERAE